MAAVSLVSFFRYHGYAAFNYGYSSIDYGFSTDSFITKLYVIFASTGGVTTIIALLVKAAPKLPRYTNIEPDGIDRSINTVFDAPVCKTPEKEKLDYVINYLKSTQSADANLLLAGGRNHINSVIQSIIEICGIPANRCTKELYGRVSQTFLDAQKGPSPDELMDMYSYYIPTREAALRILSYAEKARMAEGNKGTEKCRNSNTGSPSDAFTPNDFKVPNTDRKTICINCGKTLNAGSVYCSFCGAKVEQTKTETQFCGYCGAKLVRNAAFCSSCGRKI